MAVTFKQLASGLVSDAIAPVYPAPAGTNTQIDAATLTNNSGTDVEVTIWIGGEAVADSNKVLNARLIPANTSIGPLRELVGQVVPDGGSLFAMASIAGVVALVMSGREQSTT